MHCGHHAVVHMPIHTHLAHTQYGIKIFIKIFLNSILIKGEHYLQKGTHCEGVHHAFVTSFNFPFLNKDTLFY